MVCIGALLSWDCSRWQIRSAASRLSPADVCIIDLISTENIASINLFFYVIKAYVIAVGDDSVCLFLELGEVVDNEGAEEGGAIFEGGLVDDDVGALGFYALHNALDRTLTEIVGVGFHSKAEDADGYRSLLT